VDLFAQDDGAAEQFRLTRIQLYNWGTFSNLFDIPVAPEGYLFVGNSGSGKSTLLDAHAALLTPPKWVDFNVAAREAERHGKDRSLTTYVRGAWAEQTAEDGHYASQYLRAGTTWSALAETYQNAVGDTVVLAQILWVKGASTAPTDIRRLYLIFERSLELAELEVFAGTDFDVRRFKHQVSDALVFQEFSGYEDRFRYLLGIETQRALRLLHKTQSAKNLGDLNVFMREFMLDKPETEKIRNSLVTEFEQLNQAHQSVVSARRQIQALLPALDEHGQLGQARSNRGEFASLLADLDTYAEYRRKGLLEERIEELRVEREGCEQKARSLQAQAAAEEAALNLLTRRRADLGVDVIETLKREIDACEREKPGRMQKRDAAAAACAVMAWPVPDEPAWFVKRVSDARAHLAGKHEALASFKNRADAANQKKWEVDQELVKVRVEIESLQRQKSNLPARLVVLRANLARELRIDETALPFVGELLEVKVEQAEWQGAIERVLGGFARSLLVNDLYFAQVAAYVNSHHVGEHLTYHRIVPQRYAGTRVGPNSLVHKLNFARHDHTEWLREELKNYFDYECAEDMEAFRASNRAVTRQGQVRHSSTRFEKNDRHAIDDRRNWVLGFDNKAKLAEYTNRGLALLSERGAAIAQIDRISEEERRYIDQIGACQKLEMLNWADVDVASLLTRIDELTRRLDAELKSRPDLAALQSDIVRQQLVVQDAQKRVSRELARVEEKADEIRKRAEQREKLLALYPTADKAPVRQEALAMRYDQMLQDRGTTLTLESLSDITRLVSRGLQESQENFTRLITQLENGIGNRFAGYIRDFPAESAGLGASLEFAEDFFSRLTRLQSDDLPRFEQRFFDLLRQQSDQNLTLLRRKLDDERRIIKERIELVNESLRTTEYGPGTHLVIETADLHLKEVADFRADLTAVLSHSFGAESEVAEERFAALQKLVRRLGSEEAADRHWQTKVLDVRLHVEFVARELDSAGVEVEVYRSGAGKSGGQRQKLAATCLAAALRYQLGGQDRALPRFSTVVLDEAFDKADSEFTAMAMKIFKTFGFQMVVATPMKSVMTLEPFIAGACYTYIQDRRKSNVLLVEYDRAAKRLVYPAKLPHAHESEEAR
jgi:uncharacterized protein YPO0396